MIIWDDERLDKVVGVVLRTGVMLAAVLVLIGGVAWLSGHNQTSPDRRKFHDAPAQLTHIGGIVHGALALDPLYIVQLGLLILIATPVVRVLVCAAGFGLERDWTYLVISLIVLGSLLYSIADSIG